MAVNFLTDVLPQPHGFLGLILVACLKPIETLKEIGDKKPYYNTEISIFSFTWTGLAAFFSSDKI